ncbi:hypothetical protein T4E_3675 [Trichinella pseudospiralis]|uniref:Uncharacterized protein n=1 Tax=Trichinella pseudospiralis TaxID=6337 RepID=A0A0V0Y8V8_TRIPS|nr:hypothetical protein T4E_3675 [Trichinella pseudospiralis]
MDSPLHAQYDHMRRTVDALTALGKDPRKGELSPTEITNAISRDRLPTPLRIKWNKKTKVDQTNELGTKLRLTPGAETDEARTKALNWLARTKWRKQSGIHERNTGTSAKGACKEKTIELIKATSPLPSATGFHLLVRLQTAVSEDRLVTDDVINAQDCAAIDDEVNVHEFTEGTVEEIVEELL